jgi:hypothetical protein
MKIPIRVYEEIKNLEDAHNLYWDTWSIWYNPNSKVDWKDNNGINTPYLVTVV